MHYPFPDKKCSLAASTASTSSIPKTPFGKTIENIRSFFLPKPPTPKSNHFSSSPLKEEEEEALGALSMAMGAVIGVLAVIVVLGVISAVIGRLCTGRSVFGYGRFDLENWIERKCASCIDGRVDSGPPPPQPPPPATPAPPAPAPAANGGKEGSGAELGA